MSAQMTRFRGPSRSDEYCNCVGCLALIHYTRLDDSGRCEYCRPETEPKDENTLIQNDAANE